MNLLTPIAGFLIGYGGIMGYQVIDSTYKGEMPGPKSFGYFIGGMTLLSAATIYALGRTDKVFNAEGNYNDFIEDMEGVIGKYGEMKDFDSGYNPQDNLLKARMVVEVDDDDFDNVEFDAEMMMPEKQCVICGGPYIGYGHNPEPIFPMSRGRCCDVCNATVVIPYRLGGMNFRFGEDFESETTRKFRNRFDIKERGNPRSRAATGVKRGVWKNFFRKDAEGMSDELARVRTMSGKPVSETLRKLKQDKNLSAKDARTRKEIKAEYNDVKSVRLEKSNTDSYFTDDQPEYPTGNWVVEGENIYLITTYRPHPVGSNGAMDKLEPKRVVINARGEGLTEELAYEDYSNKAREMLSTRKESKAENMEVFEAPKSKTLSQLKDTLTAKDRKAFDNQNWRYWDSPDSIWNEQHTYHQRITDRLKKNGFKKSGMSVETMIKKIPSAWTRFYNKWWAVGKSNFAYFGHPNHIGANIFNWSDLLDVEIWTKDNQIVMVWQFKHHDHGDASPWLEQTFTLPTKSKPKTAKKTTTRKAKPKAAKKLTAKTGRKAPTISATRRKIGTRMRGNDGKMWEVKKSGKSQRWIAGAEGINKKGISWIDTEDDEGLKQDWDDETNIIENHLSSQGYNKCGSGKFFSDRTYAWVLHRFRRYIQDLPDKIKGYRGVVEDREYLEYFRDDQFVFSPWENKSKNKVALVWQFYDHHGFLVSEPYYKYFSLTTPPSWYHNKFELHIGEDYRYDACPICDYNNPMTTQSDARKLAAHIYSHGPIINGSPFNDFYIDIEPQYSNDASANFGWGNPMWGPDVEIIASQLPYLYGFNFAEYWSPTKSQQARYRKKANAIKAGLRAAGFKPKR